MNGLQVLKYSLSPIFFSNKKYMVLARCNKHDKEKIYIGFVTHSLFGIPYFIRHLRYEYDVEGILYLCSQK